MLFVDDNFSDHPKVSDLSDGAFRLFVDSMCYCSRLLTDGFISPAQFKFRKRFSPKRLAELIESGLIHDVGEGCGSDKCPEPKPGVYLLHDYLQWNKSKDFIVNQRAKNAARVSKYRQSN